MVIDGATIDHLAISVSSAGVTSASLNTGALVGRILNNNAITITNIAVGRDASATAVIKGSNDFIGGVIGIILTGPPTSVTVHNLGLPINGTSSYIGGLVGQISDSITLIGTNQATITSTGNYVGGLVGNAEGEVTGASSGSVTGAQYTGGAVGNIENAATVVSSGLVTSSVSYVGGVGGKTSSTESIIAAAWGNLISTLDANQVNAGALFGEVGRSGDITGYGLGWLGVIRSSQVSNIVGNNNSASGNLNLYGQNVTGYTDRVGSIGGTANIVATNMIGTMRTTAPGTTALTGLTNGTAVGEWTYSAGNWPKLNLPVAVTEILDLTPSIPSPPTGFVD